MIFRELDNKIHGTVKAAVKNPPFGDELWIRVMMDETGKRMGFQFQITAPNVENRKELPVDAIKTITGRTRIHIFPFQIM